MMILVVMKQSTRILAVSMNAISLSAAVELSSTDRNATTMMSPAALIRSAVAARARSDATFSLWSVHAIRH